MGKGWETRCSGRPGICKCLWQDSGEARACFGSFANVEERLDALGASLGAAFGAAACGADHGLQGSISYFIRRPGRHPEHLGSLLINWQNTCF